MRRQTTGEEAGVHARVTMVLAITPERWPIFPCPHPSHSLHASLIELLHQAYSAERPLLTANPLDVASHGLVLLSDDSAWAQGVEAAGAPKVRGMFGGWGRTGFRGGNGREQWAGIGG